MSGEDSAYSALGLRAGATRAQVDEAYRRLIKRYHPDMPEGDPGRAAEINRAYAQLRRQGAAVSVRPPRRPPVPVSSRSRPRGGRTGLALVGAVAVVAALGLANSETQRGARRASHTIPISWAGSSDPVASIDTSPEATFDSPLETAVIDRAIADAVKLNAEADGAATVEFSRACHERLRRDPSLTWFDSCVAFDEATVTLGQVPSAQASRFDESSMTARQMGAARMLSEDSLAADSRLKQIRSRVEMALMPRLDAAAAPQP